MSIIKVAEAAGVSHTTVSRVINNHPMVSMATAQRVHHAMKQIGYTPPQRRRGPKPKITSGIRTGNIGLLLDKEKAGGATIGQVLEGIDNTLGQRSMHLMVSYVRSNEPLPLFIRDNLVDGLLILADLLDELYTEQLSKFPAVWLMARTVPDRFGDRVAYDEQAVGAIAAEYLAQRGHHHLAFATPWPTHPMVQVRRDSFNWTARQKGLTVSEFMRDPPQQDQVFPLRMERFGELISQCVAELARDTDRPTGLFVPSALLIPHVYRTLSQHGVRPMVDIDIITCDIDPVLNLFAPKAATIDLQPAQIGQSAVNHLLDMLKHPQSGIRNDVKVVPQLVPAQTPFSASGRR